MTNPYFSFLEQLRADERYYPVEELLNLAVCPVQSTDSSMVIEGMLARLPLPALVLKDLMYKDPKHKLYESGGYEVLGLGSRIWSSISRYVADCFPLSNCQLFKDKEGCYFSELPPAYRRRIREGRLTTIRLEIQQSECQQYLVDYYTSLEALK